MIESRLGKFVCTCAVVRLLMCGVPAGAQEAPPRPTVRIIATDAQQGAIPGAIPPMMGWTAARNALEPGAWSLFAILFLWQLPHFLAIAWMYREDYGRAGILMLPVVEPEGRVTGQQIVIYTIMLIPVSLLPAFLGISGRIYLYGAAILGLLFLYSSLRAAFSKSRQEARRLLLASVLYLPLLFILMVLDK